MYIKLYSLAQAIHGVISFHATANPWNAHGIWDTLAVIVLTRLRCILPDIACSISHIEFRVTLTYSFNAVCIKYTLIRYLTWFLCFYQETARRIWVEIARHTHTNSAVTLSVTYTHVLSFLTMVRRWNVRKTETSLREETLSAGTLSTQTVGIFCAMVQTVTGKFWIYHVMAQVIFLVKPILTLTFATDTFSILCTRPYTSWTCLTGVNQWKTQSRTRVITWEWDLWQLETEMSCPNWLDLLLHVYWLCNEW